MVESTAVAAPSSAVAWNAREARWPSVTRKEPLRCVVRAAARGSSPWKEPRSQASAVSWLAGRTSCGGPLPPTTRVTKHHIPLCRDHHPQFTPTTPPSGHPIASSCYRLFHSASSQDGVHYPRRCHGQVSSPATCTAGNIGPSHTDCGLQRYGLLEAWYDSMILTPALACSNHRPLQVSLVTTLLPSSSLPQ
jgi:hypothetical protein